MNPYTPSSQCIIYCRTNIWSQIVFWLILFCTFNIIRFLLNYKYKMGEKTFVDDIVKHSVSKQENIPWYTNSRALTPKLLGCIVNDIWNDGAVKRNLVGPTKNRRLVLNNLVRQEAEDLDQPPSGWSLICDGTIKGSLVHLEDWEFQNRRVSTEIKYEYKDGRTSYELHSTGRSLDIDELYLGLDTTNPTRMLPELYRLSTLFDCTNLCAGINTHSNVITKVPHQVGKVTDCTNMAEETRMFSNDCGLLINHTGTNHCSMCAKLLRVENQCHKRKRNMDTTNNSCNKKYLTKNEVVRYSWLKHSMIERKQ